MQYNDDEKTFRENVYFRAEITILKNYLTELKTKVQKLYEIQETTAELVRVIDKKVEWLCVVLFDEAEDDEDYN